jgi:hypothetical protein
VVPTARTVAAERQGSDGPSSKRHGFSSNPRALPAEDVGTTVVSTPTMFDDRDGFSATDLLTAVAFGLPILALLVGVF